MIATILMWIGAVNACTYAAAIVWCLVRLVPRRKKSDAIGLVR